MGRRGPQPEPAALRLLKGDGGGKDSSHKPVNFGPKFDRSAPEAPEWLSRPAREEWHRAVAELEPLDLLKAGDFAALVVHCETWATWLQSLAIVRKEGTVLTHPVSGKAFKNPAQTVLETAASQLRASCREFGLTPSAEQNLAAGGMPANGSDDVDPFADSG